MIKTRTLLARGLFAISIVAATAMQLPEIKDFLGVGKQLSFNNDRYELKWSSHPTERYYKHEYLKRGEELGAYHNMILFEAIAGNLSIKDALDSKVAELNSRKKWDFVANYNVYESKEKPTEGIIDFVVSDTMTSYEWNLYRYQVQKGSDNSKSLMVLFAYSYRDSLTDDNDLKKFFAHIQKRPEDMINRLSQYSIPQVTIDR